MMKSQSEQGYLDSDDEEPESEQDYLDSDNEEPESEQESYWSGFRSSGVKSEQCEIIEGKKLGALVGDKDIPLENGGGTFNPGQFDFFDFFFSRELCKPNIERLRVPDLNQPANTDKQQV